MFNIVDLPIVLVAVGVVLALVATRFGMAIAARLTRKRRKAVVAKSNGVGQGHTMRSIEAELRVARKKADVAEQKLEAMQCEMVDLRKEYEEGQIKLARGEEELAVAEKTLRDEIAKTVSLRYSLSHKAEETIRAQVKVRDIETELSIRDVGVDLDDDALEEIAAEHDELTGRLKALQAKIDEASRD